MTEISVPRDDNFSIFNHYKYFYFKNVPSLAFVVSIESKLFSMSSYRHSAPSVSQKLTGSKKKKNCLPWVCAFSSRIFLLLAFPPQERKKNFFMDFILKQPRETYRHRLITSFFPLLASNNPQHVWTEI